MSQIPPNRSTISFKYNGQFGNTYSTPTNQNSTAMRYTFNP